jgi:hypothetical protein
MNKTSCEREQKMIAALVEGNSIRSVELMTGIHREAEASLDVNDPGRYQSGAECQSTRRVKSSRRKQILLAAGYKVSLLAGHHAVVLRRIFSGRFRKGYFQ